MSEIVGGMLGLGLHVVGSQLDRAARQQKLLRCTSTPPTPLQPWVAVIPNMALSQNKGQTSEDHAEVCHMAIGYQLLLFLIFMPLTWLYCGSASRLNAASVSSSSGVAEVCEEREALKATLMRGREVEHNAKDSIAY